MRRGTRAGIGAVTVTAALVAAVPAVAPAAKQATQAKKKPKPKTVRIFDNYYAPAKLTVKPGTKVTWKWPVDVGDNHDVATKSIPKKAKKFKSPPYAAGPAKWSQTFKQPGKYKLYCTFHETEMTMTITVKKP